jgi:uncharacterized phiE125 gp8 family phage protein
MLLQTSLQVTTPPAMEPVSIDLVRRHCRIDTFGDDDLLESYLMAARIMAEGYLSRVLITQTLLWTVRPSSLLEPERSHLPRAILLPRAPVQSIVSVNMLDELGNTTTILPATLPVISTWDVLGYVTDLALEPCRLTIGPETLLVDGRTAQQARLGNIQIAMVAGYGDTADTVPLPIVQAIMLTTAFLYEHRGDEGGEMPMAARWLLDRHRLQFLG